MRKTRIKGGSQPNKETKKRRLPKPLNLIINKVLPVIVLLVIGFLFIPTLSMNFQSHNKQVQTINVGNVNNQHYITDQNIESTPTFKNMNTGRAFVITDKQNVKQYLEKGE